MEQVDDITVFHGGSDTYCGDHQVTLTVIYGIADAFSHDRHSISKSTFDVTVARVCVTISLGVVIGIPVDVTFWLGIR
jgi:hypothetical protein